MNDVQVYKRGQIWMQKGEAHRSGFRNSVQSDGRPCVILTSDYGCAGSPVLMVVPITHTINPQRVNVTITGVDGKEQNVLCNQVQTVSGNDLVRYMGCVTDTVLRKIEDTVMYSMGIVREPSQMPADIERLKQLIENTAIMKFNELSTQSETNNIVEDIARGLEDLYTRMQAQYVANLGTAEQRLKKQMDAAPVLEVVTHAKPEEPVVLKPNTGTNPPETPKKPGKRNYTYREKGYWTPERTAQFLADKDTMLLDEWVKKYEFDSPKQAMKRYYHAKSMLNKESK